MVEMEAECQFWILKGIPTLTSMLFVVSIRNFNRSKTIFGRTVRLLVASLESCVTQHVWDGMMICMYVQ